MEADDTDFTGAQLNNIHGFSVIFNGSLLYRANMYGAFLARAHFDCACLRSADLSGAKIPRGSFGGASLRAVDLRGSDLSEADFGGCAGSIESHRYKPWATNDVLDSYDYQSTPLSVFYKPWLVMRYVRRRNDLQNRQQTSQSEASRGEDRGFLVTFSDWPADLRDVVMDSNTSLKGTILQGRFGAVQVGGVSWGEADLRGIQLSDRLGDERPLRTYVRQSRASSPFVFLRRFVKIWGVQSFDVQLSEYARSAAEANLRVAVALAKQGMRREADAYGYRARIAETWGLQNFLARRSFVSAWFLRIICGWGYRPLFTVIWYGLMLLLFAIGYSVLGPHLNLWQSLLLSVTAFHGRGLVPAVGNVSTPVAALAAGEAVVGLVLEATFVATFVQRVLAPRY
jgi:hypothetical protein